MANEITVASWTKRGEYSGSKMRNGRGAWDIHNGRGRQYERRKNLLDANAADADWPKQEYERDLTDRAEEAMYKLGRTYEGQYRSSKNAPWKQNYRRQNINEGSKKRLSPRWLRGVKSFQCGEPHMANQRHPHHEVSAAVKRLKQKHHTALLTVANLECIQAMQDPNYEEGGEEGEDEANLVGWADEDKEGEKLDATIAEDVELE